MRVAMVNATHSWGGVKTLMVDLSEYLIQNGHTVFTYARQAVYVEEAQKRFGHGVYSCFGADLNPCAVGRFLREFRRNGVDILLTNIKKDITTAGVAARILGIPVVQVVGLPDDMRPTFINRVLDALIKPYYFSPSRYIGEGFERCVPYVPKERSVHIVNGKRLARTPQTLAVPRRLIATQQLIEGKGHIYLLQALAELTHLPWHLDVVGTGGLAPWLEEQANALGLAGRVTWHGFSTDVRALLAQADIFLLASEYEGLPNTLEEALAEGLLPICREIGGVKEVLDDVLQQWLVPVEAKAPAFKALIERALALPDAELLRLKAQARECCRRFCEFETQYAAMTGWLAGLVAKA